jgi:hypothetical protein
MTGMPKNTLRFVLAALAFGLLVYNHAWAQVQSTADQSPIADATARGGVAVFQDYAKYPPESRPLNVWNWDLLHPWLTESTPIALVSAQTLREIDALQKSGLSEQDISQNVAVPSALAMYQFDLNKTILAGTHDKIRAQLTVTSPDDGAPLQIHVVKAELIGDDSFGSPSLGSVPFSCENDSTACTFHWNAPSTDRKYWGALELQVTLTVEGREEQFVARQAFYSSPMVAGRFTGSFSERLVSGSLVIDAGVEVRRRMACFVSANLFSADQELPVQSVERRLIVDPSMKTIPLTFFGKIFRDSAQEGAFRVQDVRAQCENLPYPPEWFMNSLAHRAELQAFRESHRPTMEPARIYFEYTPASYVTQRYAGGDFSDAEWQSPAKARKLASLQKLAADLDDPALAARKAQQ